MNLILCNVQSLTATNFVMRGGHKIQALVMGISFNSYNFVTDF